LSRIVLDTSVAAAWLLREELDAAGQSALRTLRSDGVLVPILWHYEIRNALLVAERRGRIPEGGAGEGLDALRNTSIETDNEADLDAAMALARGHGLSYYDALYLELARRRELPLATRDTALARAASDEGVNIVR